MSEVTTEISAVEESTTPMSTMTKVCIGAGIVVITALAIWGGMELFGGDSPAPAE